MITFIEKGNIFKVKGVNNYAHGCNCAGAMGKGIALEFKKRYPHMYKEYKELCKKGEFKLGYVYTYRYENGYVFNLGTQESWKTKVDLIALEISVDKMFQISKENCINNIAIPRIGAGLGGGNWAEIRNILIKISNKYPDINLYVIENFENIQGL